MPDYKVMQESTLIMLRDVFIAVEEGALFVYKDTTGELVCVFAKNKWERVTNLKYETQ